MRCPRLLSRRFRTGLCTAVPRTRKPGYWPSARLDAVLDAVYAAFTEGWSDPAGTDPARREFTCEALFPGHLVAELLPVEPEALGLLALMLHAGARRRARLSADGEYVPLTEQDQTKWDWKQIREAEALIRQAGAYRTVEANWQEVVQLYDALLDIAGSPVVALNRAIAVGALEGPTAALAILDALSEDRRLAGYQPYWAARADLLARAGAPW